MFLCDEGYKSRYAGKGILTTHDAIHDNLPVMNGLVWTKLPRYAGIYFCDEKGERITLTDFVYEEKEGEGKATLIHEKGEIVVRLFDGGVTITSAAPFYLDYDFVEMLAEEEVSLVSDKSVAFKKRGYPYTLTLQKGKIAGRAVASEEGEVSIKF